MSLCQASDNKSREKTSENKNKFFSKIYFEKNSGY